MSSFHVTAEFFTDVQPFVQSALDGHNVSIFAYGQTCSGKTHTMEGSSHDRGLYARCFEELFDVSNSDTTSTSRFNFFVTVVELHNEQVTPFIFYIITYMGMSFSFKYTLVLILIFCFVDERFAFKVREWSRSTQG